MNWPLGICKLFGVAATLATVFILYSIINWLEKQKGRNPKQNTCGACLHFNVKSALRCCSLNTHRMNRPETSAENCSDYTFRPEQIHPIKRFCASISIFSICLMLTPLGFIIVMIILCFINRR